MLQLDPHRGRLALLALAPTRSSDALRGALPRGPAVHLRGRGYRRELRVLAVPRRERSPTTGRRLAQLQRSCRPGGPGRPVASGGLVAPPERWRGDRFQTGRVPRSLGRPELSPPSMLRRPRAPLENMTASQLRSSRSGSSSTSQVSVELTSSTRWPVPRGRAARDGHPAIDPPATIAMRDRAGGRRCSHRGRPWAGGVGS